VNPDRYAVLQARQEPYDFSRVSHVLKEVCGMPLADATYLTRHFNGILVRDLPAHTAERLVNALAGSGLETFALREDAFANPPPAEEVTNMDCRAEGLVLQDTLGGSDVTTIPWPSVTLVSCGRVDMQETQKIYSPSRQTPLALQRTPHAASHGPAPPAVRRVEKTVEHTIADIFTSRAAGHLRIDMRRFNFDYLGSRKAPSAAANFRLLLMDIAQAAPGLWANGGLNELLAGRQPTHYRKLADFEEESLWLLQLIALEEDRGH